VFRYGNLTDALSYAELVSSRANELAARKRENELRSDHAQDTATRRYDD
jgi:hypothetical protein